VCDNGLSLHEIDSWTSDDLAFSIEFRYPIFTTEEIMAQAGILFKEEEPSTDSIDSVLNDEIYSDSKSLSITELEEELQKAIDASAATGNAYSEQLKEAVKDENAEVLVIAAELEAEIAELESKEDREIFLADAGLTEPGVNKVVQAAYKLLNLMSFFTVGVKEVRVWTIHRGMTAPQAAGVIHSDLERSFIRAEVIKYNDFITLKTEQACKEHGKLAIEGKNYIVGDGDCLNIRFNV
jgi:ribosome-binding ATPase YchF (GTP1/OBG family)